MPAVTPVTVPEVPTVAFELLLLHVPPLPSASAVVEPAQTLAVPVIDAAAALTVIEVVAVHVPPSEYVIVVTPGDTRPVTTPVEPTDAKPGALLLHVPPPGSVKVMGDPIHTVEGPEIGEGAEITVTAEVATQPEGSV